MLRMRHGAWRMPGLLQLPYQSNCSGRSAAASRADAARAERTWYTYHEIFMSWLPVAGTAAWRVAYPVPTSVAQPCSSARA